MNKNDVIKCISEIFESLSIMVYKCMEMVVHPIPCVHAYVYVPIIKGYITSKYITILFEVYHVTSFK